MGTNTVSILTVSLCLLCGILHGIKCQNTTFTEKLFSKKTGVLYQSPYAGPEMTCSERPCTAISCARACQEEAGCVVFSHNEAKAKCILSRRLIMTLRTTRSVTRSGMSITLVTVLMDCCPLILKLVTDRDRHTHSKPRFPAPSSKEEGCCKPELGVSFANRRTGARTGTGTHIHPVLGISFTNTRTGARTGTGTHIHMHFTHNNLTLTIMCLLN